MTKYDDADWHEGSVIEAGKPAENAFTHIGLYLAWLIRNDMANPEFFSGDDLAAVKAGTMTGSQLQSGVDGKLMSDMLTKEGAAFSDWYYPKYIDDYAEAFADSADYEVVEDEQSRSRIEPVLARRLSEWTADGRPRGQEPSFQEMADSFKWDQVDPVTKKQLVEQMEKIAEAMGVELPPDFINLTQKPAENAD